MEYITGAKDYEWYNLEANSFELSYNYFKNVTKSIVIFSADINEIQYTRKVYDEFDLLGDIGGFFSAFRIIGSFFIYYFGTFNFETLLISKVFKKNGSKS